MIAGEVEDGTFGVTITASTTMSLLSFTEGEKYGVPWKGTGSYYVCVLIADVNQEGEMFGVPEVHISSATVTFPLKDAVTTIAFSNFNKVSFPFNFTEFMELITDGGGSMITTGMTFEQFITAATAGSDDEEDKITSYAQWIDRGNPPFYTTTAMSTQITDSTDISGEKVFYIQIPMTMFAYFMSGDDSGDSGGDGGGPGGEPAP